MKMSENYSTYDMNLASILSVKYSLIEIVNEDGRGRFIFEDSDDLRQFVQDFWDRKLTIDPIALFDAIKLVKNRLYSSVRKEAR